MAKFVVLICSILIMGLAAFSCQHSTSIEEAADLSIVLTSDISSGNGPFEVEFHLQVFGNIDSVETCVPGYKFDSGSGTINDRIIFCRPDTFTLAERNYSWTHTYDGLPGIRKASAILMKKRDLVYSDTLLIEVK